MTCCLVCVEVALELSDVGTARHSGMSTYHARTTTLRFKLVTLTCNTRCSTQPAYLHFLLNYHTPTRSLRSANTNLLSAPRVRTLKPGLGVSYTILSGNGVCLFYTPRLTRTSIETTGSEDQRQTSIESDCSRCEQRSDRGRLRRKKKQKDCVR